MPIEIRELVVRAIVTEEGSGDTQPSSSQDGKKEEASVQIAIDQLKEIIRKKKER